MISRPLQRLTAVLPVSSSRRGRMKRSMRASRSAPLCRVGLSWSAAKRRSIRMAGSQGTRLRVMPMPMNRISRPNGVLTPGMETGNRKGTVSSTQNSSMPCSPTRASMSRRLIWLSSMAWAVARSVSESRCCGSLSCAATIPEILVLLKATPVAAASLRGKG
ncbi:hypothetical protein D3C80_939850 [compost metagenome]